MGTKGSASTPEPSRARSSNHRAKWLILVERDQLDLYEHLVKAFDGDGQVEVQLDRRRDYSRNAITVTERLRNQGAAVIRRQSENGR